MSNRAIARLKRIYLYPKLSTSALLNKVEFKEYLEGKESFKNVLKTKRKNFILKNIEFMEMVYSLSNYLGISNKSYEVNLNIKDNLGYENSLTSLLLHNRLTIPYSKIGFLAKNIPQINNYIIKSTDIGHFPKNYVSNNDLLKPPHTFTFRFCSPKSKKQLYKLSRNVILKHPTSIHCKIVEKYFIGKKLDLLESSAKYTHWPVEVFRCLLRGLTDKIINKYCTQKGFLHGLYHLNYQHARKSIIQNQLIFPITRRTLNNYNGRRLNEIFMKNKKLFSLFGNYPNIRFGFNKKNTSQLSDEFLKFLIKKYSTKKYINFENLKFHKTSRSFKYPVFSGSVSELNCLLEYPEKKHLFKSNPNFYLKLKRINKLFRKKEILLRKDDLEFQRLKHRKFNKLNGFLNFLGSSSQGHKYFKNWYHSLSQKQKLYAEKKAITFFNKIEEITRNERLERKISIKYILELKFHIIDFKNELCQNLLLRENRIKSIKPRCPGKTKMMEKFEKRRSKYRQKNKKTIFL